MKEALTSDACLNCMGMPLAERSARLGSVESEIPSESSAPGPSKEPKRRKRTHGEAPIAKRAHYDQVLSNKVDTLTSEFAQIKSLLLSLQPGMPVTPLIAPCEEADQTRALGQQEEDVMSIAASESLFLTGDSCHAADIREHSPGPSVVGSHTSEPDSLLETGPGLPFVKQAVNLALSRLGIDNPPVGPTAQSAFFKDNHKQGFEVPVSQPYIEELHRCWADPKLGTHLPQDCRALSSMHDAAQYGLNHMPSVDSVIANLVVAPADASRPVARCPRPQCRVTDELLAKSYDSAARIGRLGNSLSHLALALSQSLKEAGVDDATQTLSDASLQTFAYMARELGRLMSTLVITRRQVWLAQSPLSESCRSALRSLPVVPGQVFGPAAQQTLERAVEAARSRQQFAEIQRASRPQPYRRATFHSTSRAPPSSATTSTAVERPTQRPVFREPPNKTARTDRARRAPHFRPQKPTGPRDRGGRV